jgi:hypothetical protein
MSWEHWRGEIAKAADGAHHTIESIEALIQRGVLKVWMAPDCCLLVEIMDYPQARACQVMWAAGELDAIKAQSPAVEAWARSVGCSEMLVESRPAWKRALKDIGYEPWSLTVRKEL